MSDYYELLEIPRNAAADAIKKAYRQLARQFHPDSNKSQIAAEHMKLLNAAYDTLSDPIRRREYDEQLAAEAHYGVTHDAFVPQAAAPPSAPRATLNPWLIVIAGLALGIVVLLIGTLFLFRNQLASFVLPNVATPTRAPVVAAAPTRAAPTYTPTPTPSPTALPTATRPAPSATPSNTPPPTATLLPPTATPLIVAPPNPVPSVAAGAFRLVTSEFQNGASGPRDVFASDADGGNKINLTHSESRNEQSPSWSPQGQNVVFSEFNSGFLYITNAEGNQLTQLTSDPAIRDANPAWSPAGSLIAFTSIARNDLINGLNDKSKVFVVDPNTRQRKLIADLPGRDLTWSPDGKWLAFRVQISASQTLYMAASDGHAFFYYQTGAATLRRIAWTLDSKQVVYEAIVREQSEVYVTTLQPTFTVQRLSGSLSVVSPHGRFPGLPFDGEWYPPVISEVRR